MLPYHILVALKIDDLFDVCSYIKNLDKSKLVTLGGALGLLYPKLKKMPNESLPADMVQSWLGQEDNVADKSGVPTWQSLANALDQIGQTGIAKSIRQHKGSTLLSHGLFGLFITIYVYI